MKLSFVIPSSTLRTTTKKTVKSIAGGQERLDVISRCLLNADRWKSRLTTNVEMIVYLSHPEEQKALFINLEVNSPEINNEFSSTIELLGILKEKKTSISTIDEVSFDEVIKKIAQKSKIYYLSPDGSKLSKDNLKPTKNSSLCFVLGSQHDLSKEQEDVLNEVGVIPISLGSKDYLASHVITIVCYYLFTNL